MLKAAAVIWGFAEATLFFVVPDMLLSYVALKKLRAALFCCLPVTAGALVGGSAMYWLGTQNADETLRAVDIVPAISPQMIDRVGHRMERDGIAPMVVGAFIGTPYKIYAVKAGALGIPLPLFLLVSIPARLLRFVAVSLLVHGIARSLRGWSDRGKIRLLTAFWIVFYAGFLTLMPG
jgi:membrane protein YqaA with SNARE-associated domain